jgi:hypothetical protein
MHEAFQRTEILYSSENAAAGCHEATNQSGVYGDFDVIVYKLVSSYHGMCFTWVVFALPTLFDV